MKGGKWLSLLVIAAVLILSLAIVFSSNDPAVIADTITRLHPGWVMAAVGCWAGSSVSPSAGASSCASVGGSMVKMS